MLTRLLFVLVLLILTTACSAVSSAPKTPSPSAAPGLSVSEKQQTSETPTVAPSDCFGDNYIQQIRAEYAANHLRATDTYINQRVCLRGTIGGFHQGGSLWQVYATIGESARFTIGFSDRISWDGNKSEEENEEILRKREVLREWMMTSSVGDAVEAECRIQTFAPTKQQPKMTPEIPIFTNCEWVEE